MSKIVLASKSPRRTELFKRYGIMAENIPADIDESIPEDIKEPAEIVKYLAQKKALYVSAAVEPGVITVAADTLVFCNDRILGKPANKEEARSMLQLLSGKTHSVISGVCIIRNNKKVCESVKTDVVFRELTREEIEGYISTDEPYDKAGGYGIQSLAGVFVTAINGDYYNIVGLPVSRLVSILKNQFGYDALENLFFPNGDYNGKS